MIFAAETPRPAWIEACAFKLHNHLGIAVAVMVLATGATDVNENVQIQMIFSKANTHINALSFDERVWNFQQVFVSFV